MCIRDRGSRGFTFRVPSTVHHRSQTKMCPRSQYLRTEAVPCFCALHHELVGVQILDEYMSHVKKQANCANTNDACKTCCVLHNYLFWSSNQLAHFVISLKAVLLTSTCDTWKAFQNPPQRWPSSNHFGIQREPSQQLIPPLHHRGPIIFG